MTFVRPTETCWYQVAMTALSRFLTSESQRSSRLLKAFTRVKNSLHLLLFFAFLVLFVLYFFKLFFHVSHFNYRFENILDTIYCVRWNPSGDMIASASHDQTAKLLDFKTGKVLHTGTTPDGSNYLLTNIN